MLSFLSKTVLRSFAVICCIAIVCVVAESIHAVTPVNERPIVQIQTSMGDILIRLFPDRAPKTCENFLMYVGENYYDDTLFHRVIDGFIMQGGGFTSDYEAKPSRPGIKNESKGGVSNSIGTVAMALRTDTHSASTQFFINLANNIDLDYSTKKGRGYTVFAEVIDGMSTIDKIKKVRTKRITVHSDLYKRNVPLYDVPEVKVVIKKIQILRSAGTQSPAN